MSDPALIRPATPHDIDCMIAGAREADREEARLAGVDFATGIRQSVEVSREVWAGFWRNELVAIWGVWVHAPLEAGGIPWLIATPAIERCGLAFGRHSRYSFERLRAGFDYLENAVWEGNTLAIQWLKWLGFTVDPPFSLNGARFCRFEWRRSPCA